jgi:hypothetical protein
MSIATIHDPQLDPFAEPSGPLHDEMRSRVCGLLSTLYPQHELMERRHQNRYPFPYLVQLTPVARDGVTPQGEPVVVVGKHLSESGLGFYHPRPLPHRRMIATLETGSGQRLRFLIDLHWCRFTRQGWYESGGRLLRSVECSE